MKYLHVLLLAALTLLPHNNAWAAQDCTLVVDYKTSEIIHESGDCKTRHGAESTFKLPLALMGFDSGILKDENTPQWDYKPEYKATIEAHRHPADPARWEKDSVVWFSQELTRTLGADKFKEYIEALDYGNKDISGDPGKDNGLTHSWLSSSLKISPVEQVAFIRNILNRKFPLSGHAYDMTLSIIPQFPAGEWSVHGKTGTGFQVDKNGKKNRALQVGWFVGWAEHDGQKIIFAKYIADKGKQKTYAGPRTRDAFLKEFPSIMQHHSQAQH